MAVPGAESRRAGGLPPVLRVLAPFALCFGLANYYRSMNAVLSPHLIADLRLTAGDLGLLISVYFLTSAALQAPLGLLMDRYGPRRVQGTLIAVAGAGCLIFALGQDRGVLMLGRAIMGIGAAGALMTSLHAVTLWFPAARWPFFNGCVMSVGGLGGLAATLPTEWMLDLSDWRHLMIGTALASFAGCALIFAVVPEKPSHARKSSLRAQLEGLGVVYRDRLFWRLAPIYMATVGASLAFLGLWSGPWLKDVARLAPAEIAGDLLVYNLLQIAGSVAVGYLASALGKRGIGLLTIVAAGTLLFIFSQSALLLPSGAARWAVLIGMGALSNVNLLCYPILSRHFPPALTGRANTALNLFVFLGAFGLQYAVGLLIDLFPAVRPGSYPTASYQFAFAVMVTIELLGWLWLMVPARKHPADHR